MKISKLRCELAENPLGIETTEPRLSWINTAPRRGATQTAYRVIAGTRAHASDLWDTGWVTSSDSHLIPYAGLAVPPGSRAFWEVAVRDEQGQEFTSDPAFWEVARPPIEDKAKWISGPAEGGPRTSAPAPYFRKTFRSKTVSSARLAITALGLYEAKLNGQKVGDHELAPGWTDYRLRLRYQTFDVTDQIKDGQNVLSVVAADGWYCGHVEWRGRQLYGNKPKLLASLRLTYTDGSSEVIVTDESWKTSQGKIVEADLIMGQAEVSGQEPTGWETAGFDDSAWSDALVTNETVNLVSTQEPPIRATGEIKPKLLKETHDWSGDRYVFDMAQNMVGRVRAKLTGKAGSTATLRFAERVNPDGTLYTANLRTAKQTDHFTFSTDGEVVFEPKFTFHGFQYVEVSGPGVKIEPEGLTGIVLHSDWEPTIEFDCSEPLVTQLHHNIHWGWKGNSVDVPTDCPQRDERLGWTGDAQVFVKTAAYHSDSQSFWAKYIWDLQDSQGSEGEIPPTSPNTDAVKQSDGGPAWADAFIIVPWTIYNQFGDRKILESHYDAIKRWVNHQEKTSLDGIRCHPKVGGWTGFGDWLSTNAETPHDVIGTAFLANAAATLSKIADVLGHTQDAVQYQQLFERVKTAFQRRFTTEDGLVYPGTQTAYVLALHFDLLPESAREQAVWNLVQDIGKRGYHLSTGFVGTPYLAHVLTKGGRLDIAYRLLLQTTWPSWLYSVTQGATTIWERWDGWTHDKGYQDAGMNSFNHYAYGAIGDWIYGTVCGIDQLEAGYRVSRLAPRPGGPLTHARAKLRTPYGFLSSGWKIEGTAFSWDIEIPTGTTARVEFPPEADEPKLEGEATVSTQVLGSGTYHLTATWQPSS